MTAILDTYRLDCQPTALDPELHALTEELRTTGRDLVPGSLSREAYIEKNAIKSILFLIDLHKWIATNFGRRADFLQLDTPESIAAIFYDFYQTKFLAEGLRILCSITHLGRSNGPKGDSEGLRKAGIIAYFLDGQPLAL